MVASRSFTTSVLCLVTCWCVVGAQTLKNVALYKPALQKDTDYEGRAHGAVDGNHNTSMFSKSCTHTASNKHTWWMVDLLANYQVKAITLTNRDIIGYRLREFSVSVSLDNPRWKPGFPEAILGHLCFYHRPPVPDGVTQTIPCTRSYLTGRYITIYKPDDWLTLCEVQVMANSYKWLDLQLFRDAKISKLPFLSINSVSSGFTCVQSCLAVRTNTTATAMQYRFSKGECQCIHISGLHSTAPGYGTYLGWNLYLAKNN